MVAKVGWVGFGGGWLCVFGAYVLWCMPKTRSSGPDDLIVVAPPGLGMAHNVFSDLGCRKVL